MKNIFTLLFAFFFTGSLFSQAPEKMSYQAVVRDGSNELVINQTVGMQISILQGRVSGISVYTETQTPTTNSNGLVSLEIGSGTSVSGTFSAIDWIAGPYFIKTETDPTGGTSYTIFGTSQLMSVPYALHANTADSIIGGVSFTEVDGSVTNEIQKISKTGTLVTLSNGGGTFTDSVNTYTAGSNITISASNVISATTGSSGHYLGELFGGGIVFYVYDNGQHGLIASLDDLDGGIGVSWSGNTSTLIGATAQSSYDGAGNTSAIVGQDATANKAATLCDSYSGGSKNDWYLPALWELNLLYNSAYLINKILENDGNGLTNGLTGEHGTPTEGMYWSSTEVTGNVAWGINFMNGGGIGSKSIDCRVRAVRAF